jgi:A/G-specific adenine glycosylase
MLQQTQVSRVLGFYDRFLARFPTLDAVARARQSEVREAWRGLGYYARARNLHRLARAVAPPNGDGIMPEEPDALRQLPGIGAYTAGAVASFAYERRATLVDTNVARVLRRVFAPRIEGRTSKGGGSCGTGRRSAPTHRKGDVVAQPGAHGAGRAGLYRAGHALRSVPGETILCD